MDEGFLQRLRDLADRKKLSYSKLGGILGVSKDTAGNYLTGRSKIPIEKLSILSQKYNVSLEWLIHGGSGENNYLSETVEEPSISYRTAPPKKHPDQGYKYSSKEINPLLGAKSNTDNGLIPYYNVQSMSTPIEVFDKTGTPTYNMSIPGFNDCDFAISVYGSSMSPTYDPGTIILCKTIHEKEIILYGECYYLATAEYNLIRRLQKSKKQGYIIAVADNNEEGADGPVYQRIELKIQDIIRLSIIKGHIKRSHV